MRRNNTPWRPVTAAALQWTPAGDPRSTTFGDVYYSRDNGLEESRQVFLQGNDLPGRWRERHCRRFCIAETGFGTGLNFLLTWQTWRARPEPRPDLHYLSVEKYPLAPADMARALAAWPELAPLAASLLQAYPGLVPGQHRLLLEAGRVTLDLWWEDVADALTDLLSREQPVVDAWYLDGFAPARNDAMWQPDILRAVAALCKPGASFATFTAAGQVRRALSEAGFEVEKMPGYGRKRECLRGRLLQHPGFTPAPERTPWDLAAATPDPPGCAIVVGAGLAGCTAAAALARRGIPVTVLDQDSIAGAGSANNQGVLYTRLSVKHSALTDFSLLSFCFAARFYDQLLRSGQLQDGIDGALCGSFHQSENLAELGALTAVLESVPQLAQVLDSGRAREIVGVDQPGSGYWFPQSGWMRPAAVCRTLINAGGIALRENCGPISIEAGAGGWLARDSDNKVLEQAPCMIVATGTGTAALSAFDWLPLQAIRGQTTDLPTSPDFSALRTALCHEGYIAPARNGVHCIGATFHPQDENPAQRVEDHRLNLEKLGSAVPAWRQPLQALDPATLNGRVGYRCASPDYLPMVGPAPDIAAFLHKFAPLRKNARQALNIRGDYMPGLYVTTAHGSRGLTSTPLAAELLASLICHETPPLDRALCRALAPARFIIRDLGRNRL